MLLDVLAENAHLLSKIDIAVDDQLVERYGLVIPVLEKTGSTGAKSELFWPFDENKINSFLGLAN